MKLSLLVLLFSLLAESAPNEPSVRFKKHDAKTHSLGSGGKDVDVANAYLKREAAKYNFRPYHELDPIGGNIRADGQFVHYVFYQDGMRIEGLYIEVKIASDYTVAGVENHYRPINKYVTGSHSELTLPQILKKSTGTYTAGPYTVEYAEKYLFVDGTTLDPILAYRTEVRDEKQGCDVSIFFSAFDGRVLKKTNGPTCMAAVAKSEPIKFPNSGDCPIDIVPGERVGRLVLGKTPTKDDLTIPPMARKENEEISTHGTMSLTLCRKVLHRVELNLNAVPDCLQIRGKKFASNVDGPVLAKLFKGCGAVTPSRVGQRMSYVQCENRSITIRWYDPGTYPTITVHLPGAPPEDSEKGFCSKD